MHLQPYIASSLPPRPAMPVLSSPGQLCKIHHPPAALTVLSLSLSRRSAHLVSWAGSVIHLQPLQPWGLPLRPAMPRFSSPGQLGRVQHVPRILRRSRVPVQGLRLLGQRLQGCC